MSPETERLRRDDRQGYRAVARKRVAYVAKKLKEKIEEPA